MLATKEKLIDIINKKLEESSFGDDPKELYEPIEYILSIGGKRMRPMLTIMAYKLYHENYENALDPALAIEIFHNFTLMHDDIMDQAPLRRGMPTVHEKWNQHTAILSGDVMMIKAYEKMMTVKPELLSEVLQKFNKCAVGVCEGQQKDMIFESRDDVTEEEYIDMIRLKTAVLLGFALELGAVIAEASEDDKKNLRLFGESVGIGFQLKDDLLDAYGEASKFGKKTGGDIVVNKKTYLLIKALEKLTGQNKKELERWITKKNFDEAEKVTAVKALYDKADIVEETNQRISYFYDKALHHLLAINAPVNKKSQLKELAKKLVDRDQ